MDPLRVHREDDRFRGRPHGEPLRQFFLTAVRHPGHLGGETFDVLGFLFQEALRDEQGKVGGDMPGLFEPPVEICLDALPDGIAVRPDGHRAPHRRVVRQFGAQRHLRVPLTEVLASLRQRRCGPALLHCGPPPEMTDAPSTV